MFFKIIFKLPKNQYINVFDLKIFKNKFRKVSFKTNGVKKFLIKSNYFMLFFKL